MASIFDNNREHEMSDQKLETSLIDTLGHSRLKDLAAEGAEMALDALLKDELLKDIPIVRIATAIFRTGISVRNRLFMKKIIRFLSEMIDVPEEEKKKFLKKLEGNPKFKQKVGETLILLLDRLDDTEKPEIVGKVFKAYIMGRIEFPDFLRLTSAIERTYLPDLFELKRYYDGQSSSDAIGQRLFSHGLLHLSVGIMFGGGQIKYSISELGKLLVEIGLIKE